METKYQVKMREKRERKMVRESARAARKQRFVHSLRTLKNRVFNVRNDVLGLMFLTSFATTGALIWCAYLFSFRNIQGLGAYLGVPDNLSVLVAPMLDTFLLFLVSVNLIFVLLSPGDDEKELQREHASAMQLFRWAMLGVGISTLVLNASYALFVVGHAGYAIFEALPSTVFVLLIEGVLRLTRLFAVVNRSHVEAMKSEIVVQPEIAQNPRSEIAVKSAHEIADEAAYEIAEEAVHEIAQNPRSEIAVKSAREIAAGLDRENEIALQSAREIAAGVIPIKRGTARTAIEDWLDDAGVQSGNWFDAEGRMKMDNIIAEEIGVSPSSICRHGGFKDRRKQIKAEMKAKEVV